MREMQQLQIIVNLSNGHAVVLNEKKMLRMTGKRQILFDFLKDLSFQTPASTSQTSPKPSLRTDPVFQSHHRMAQQPQQMMTLFDVNVEPDAFDPIFVAQTSQKLEICATSVCDYLGVSSSQFHFLAHGSADSSKSVSFDLDHLNPDFSSGHGSVQRRTPQDCARNSPSDSAVGGGKSQSSAKTQRGQDRAGHHTNHGSSESRPPSRSRLLAVHGPAQSEDLVKQVRSMDRVPDMCSQVGIHTSQRGQWTDHSPRLTIQCGQSHGTPSHGRNHREECRQPLGETDHQVHCGPGAHQEQEITGEQQRIQEQRQEKGLGWCDNSGSKPGDPSVEQQRRRRAEESSDQEDRNPVLRAEKTEEVNVQHHDFTPEEILRDLKANLDLAVFSISQQLRSLQQQHFCLWEICCSPTSNLSTEIIRNGLKAKRWTIEDGFDIERPECVREAVSALKTDCPTTIWTSLRCTP